MAKKLLQRRKEPQMLVDREGVIEEGIFLLYTIAQNVTVR